MSNLSLYDPEKRKILRGLQIQDKNNSEATNANIDTDSASENIALQPVNSNPSSTSHNPLLPELDNAPRLPIPSHDSVESACPKWSGRWLFRFTEWTITIVFILLGVVILLASHTHFLATLRHLTLDDLRSSAFVPLPSNSSWVGGDSLLHFDATGTLLLHNVTTGTNTIYVRHDSVRPETVLRTQLSGDRSLVLLEHLAYDYHDLAVLRYEVFQLVRPVYPSSPLRILGVAQYFEWGPTGTQLAFVQHNDLFYSATMPSNMADDIVQPLSRSGKSNPADWQSTGLATPKYGREILHDNRGPKSKRSTTPQVFPALWFSPGGSHLAAAEFNDSQPIAGKTMPTVDLFVWDLTVRNVSSSRRTIQAPKFKERYEGHPLLVVVQWALPDNDPDVPQRLVSAWSNRLQSEMYVIACDIAAPTLNCMRLVQLEESPLTFMSIAPNARIDLPHPILLDDDSTGRLLLIDASRAPHNFRLYAYANHSEFDATDHNRHNDHHLPYSWTSSFSDDLHIERLLHWDTQLNVVFVLAYRAPHSDQRDLYAVVVGLGGREPASDLQCLTCDKIGYSRFSARFPTVATAASNDKRPRHRYLILEWEGPDVPRHEVCEWSLNKTSSSRPLGRVELTHRYTLNRFDALRQEIDKMGWHLTNVFMNVPLRGHPWILGEIRVKLTFRALNFVDHAKALPTKTPLLLIPYDSPDESIEEQALTSKFGVDFGDFMALERSVLVVRIDGRGQIRNGRNAVKFRHLGDKEVHDMLRAIDSIVKMPNFHVDPDRVAIWGHQGYAGYLAAMTLAQDTQRNLRCAVAGEPIDNWHESEYVSGQYVNRTDMAYNATSLLENAAKIPDYKLLLVHGQTPEDRKRSKEFANRLEREDVRFESLNYRLMNKQFVYPLEGVLNFLDRCFDYECENEMNSLE